MGRKSCLKKDLKTEAADPPNIHECIPRTRMNLKYSENAGQKQILHNGFMLQNSNTCQCKCHHNFHTQGLTHLQFRVRIKIITLFIFYFIHNPLFFLIPESWVKFNKLTAIKWLRQSSRHRKLLHCHANCWHSGKWRAEGIRVMCSTEK